MVPKRSDRLIWWWAGNYRIPFVTCPAVQVRVSGFGQAAKLTRTAYPGVQQAGPAILDNRAPGEASVAVWAWRVWLKR
jgi:hypothetical protein